jgi:hypothetical protein
MDNDFDAPDALTDRLQALGRRPIDSAVQSQHLTAMAAVRPPASARSILVSRVKLGAAMFAGVLIGATGLASAGALGPLQPVAATVVESVSPLDVPKGPSENASDKAKEATAKTHAAKAADDESGDPAAKGGTERYFGAECAVLGVTTASNHGQYLKALREAGATHDQLNTAAKSDCGKPLASVNGDEPGATTNEVTTTTTAAPTTTTTDKGKSDEAPGQVKKDEPTTTTTGVGTTGAAHGQGQGQGNN